MDKRINCNDCPLFHVEVDTLCETYCSDMADYREELRADAIEEFIEKFIKRTQLRQMTKAECIKVMYDIADELKEQKQ